MFIYKLESLRGIAALMVAVGHSFIVLSVDNIPNIWVTSIVDTISYQSFITRMILVLFNGGAAVTLFFVLNGYVLGLSLDKKPINTTTFFSFYIKRIFRIYPAYIVCLLTIVISIYFFHTYISFQNTSDWFNWWYKSDLSLLNIVDNLLMLEVNLNPVSWALQVEIIASLIFPFAYIISRNVRVRLNFFILFLLMLLGVVSADYQYVVFGFVFYLGLLLPIISYLLKKYVPRFVFKTLYIVSIIFLLFSRFLFVGIEQLFVVLVEGIFAALIITMIIENEDGFFLNKLLNLDIVKKLGRISYSFYLYHFIILYWLSYCMLLFIDSKITGSYPLFLSMSLSIVSVLFSFIVACISYRYVERPMIEYGSNVAENVSNFLMQAWNR